VQSFALWGGAAGAAAIGIAAIVLLFRARRRAERALAIGQTVVAQVQAQHDALRNAIDGLPDGLVLFDAEGRLVVCNRSFAEAFARVSDQRLHGARRIDLVRAMVDVHDPQLPAAARERLVAKYIDWHRQGNKPWLQKMRGGRWLRIREKHLPDGSTVCICSDVTAFMWLRGELQEAERRAARQQADDGSRADRAPTV
jgi:PAS domain-containing protein